jgi:quaternary ammonium compound-resistance protein SugE
MSWFYLIVAGLLEAVWALGLKYTHGFTRPVPSLLVAGAIVGSMLFLSLSLRSIPTATGYAIWVGIGVLATALFDALFLSQQPLRPVQILFLVTLLLSLLGLKITATQ